MAAQLTATIAAGGSAIALLVVAATPSMAAAPAALPISGSAAAVGAEATPAPQTRASSVTAVVSTTQNSGAGSLRAALVAANRRSKKTVTTITFSTAGTIVLTSNLTPITRRVVINATSAPGYVSGGAPVVGLNANGKDAFRFDSGSAGSQLLGVAVTKARGNGVTLNAGGITVNDNHIGLTVSGSAAGNRGSGVYVARSSKKNKIGINPSKASGAIGNVISANRGAGIRVSGSSANVIQANRIGTNRSGTAAVANRRAGLELINGASKNRVGGTVYIDSATGTTNNPTGTKGQVPEVYVVPPQGNLISGNRSDGVLVSSRANKNLFNGNFIGTNAAGTGALGNAGDGIRVINADGTVLRGCTVTDNPFVYYNVVSGNRKNGLHVTNSDNTVVQANFFGIGMDNTTTVANGGNGMLFDGNSRKPHVGGVIPLGNVSAGNRQNGIAVKGRVTGFITFNTFGGLLAFKGAAPNRQNGLLVTATGGNNLARTNVFSGNVGNGIEISGNARGMTVDPNLVGLNTKGDGPLRNGKNGVLVAGNAHNNTIGGSRQSVIPQNAFSGNVGYGLVFSGNANRNRVYNTFIGTEVAKTLPVPNLKGGVLISGRAHNNYIGARGKEKLNVIAGNIGFGVELTSKTRSNSVINNKIGKGRVGLPVPNSKGTVSNKGKKNVIRRNDTN